MLYPPPSATIKAIAHEGARSSAQKRDMEVISMKDSVKIEFFYDYTCPYCAIGYDYLMELLPKYPRAEILWLPLEAHPRAEEPEHKPYVNLAVQGSYFLRDAGGDERAYFDRLRKAHFDERIAVDDIGVLAQCAADIGLDSEAFEKALTDGKYEEAQLKANEYAYLTQKVWAVPTFVCGTNRLDAVGGVGITKEQLDDLLAVCCG